MKLWHALSISHLSSIASRPSCRPTIFSSCCSLFAARSVAIVSLFADLFWAAWLLTGRSPMPDAAAFVCSQFGPAWDWMAVSPRAASLRSSFSSTPNSCQPAAWSWSCYSFAAALFDSSCPFSSSRPCWLFSGPQWCPEWTKWTARRWQQSLWPALCSRRTSSSTASLAEWWARLARRATSALWSTFA